MTAEIVGFPGNLRPIETKPEPGDVLILPVVRIEGREPGPRKRRRSPHDNSLTPALTEIADRFADAVVRELVTKPLAKFIADEMGRKK